MTKHKKQKFDSIADGHKAALIAMGVFDGAASAARDDGPECPSIFIGTMEKYHELKFIRRVESDEIKLYARDTLSWQDLLCYSQVTGNEISMHEAELIMGLEAIFEGREDA